MLINDVNELGAQHTMLLESVRELLREIEDTQLDRPLRERVLDMRLRVDSEIEAMKQWARAQ